jgi:hypothetical protein
LVRLRSKIFFVAIAKSGSSAANSIANRANRAAAIRDAMIRRAHRALKNCRSRTATDVFSGMFAAQRTSRARAGTRCSAMIVLHCPKSGRKRRAHPRKRRPDAN